LSILLRPSPEKAGLRKWWVWVPGQLFKVYHK